MDNVTSSQATATALKGVFENGSFAIPEIYDMSAVDTSWVLISAFIIFTMQTGFGMLESGIVSTKNETNIMMKNVVDIVLGGFTYWLVGYSISFGRGPLTNPFIAIGDFLTDPHVGDPLMGQIFSAFLFQLSFATTATTIVSGAMAERTNFQAYCLFSSLNTILYCIPAGWVWGEHGFLYNLGVVDIAGSGPVHLIGGAAAFASAVMLGPRLGRYANGKGPLPMGNPVNACMGLFILWWGWLFFNSGSTYGVSGAKWQYAARAAVMTMLASFGGGISSCAYTMWKNKGRVDVVDLMNGVLGALVSITAGCFLYCAWEAILIGCLGALLCCVAMPLFDKFGVDDPVGASAVHGVCGIWGVLAVGLFADNPIPLGTTNGRMGLFKGGGLDLLGIQALSAICLTCWGICSTFLLLFIINKIIPIRMDPEEELLGADLVEHKIRNPKIALIQAISALETIIKHNMEEIVGTKTIDVNSSDERSLDELRAAEDKLNQWRMFVDQMEHQAEPKTHHGSAIEDRENFAMRRKNSTSNGFSTTNGAGGVGHKNSERLEHVVSSDVGGVFKMKNTEVSTVSKGTDNKGFQ